MNNPNEVSPGQIPPPAYPVQTATYQPPGGIQYNAAGQQTVVVNTQPKRYKANPEQMKCIYCQQDIVTATHSKVGMMNWAGCGMVCLIGLGFPLFWLGCQFIPCCIPSLKDVVHTCPNCQKEIGTYERLS